MAAKKKTAKKTTAKAKANLTKAGHKKFKAPRQIFITLQGNKDVTGTYLTFKDAKDGAYEGDGSEGALPEQVVGPYFLAERARQE